MRRTLNLICSLVFIAMLPALTLAQNSNSSAKATAPKDDAGIQKCIGDKLAASASLKSQGITAAVSNGTATLTGKVKNAGSKGAATNIAKSCGAKSVTNDITIAELDDDTIQKCINDKFASSPSLKTQGFSAAVSHGVATLTGVAKDAGSKGAATNIAKKCGAKNVTNSITISATAKPSGI